MYLEFLYFIFDYLFTLNKKERWFEWGIPTILGVSSAVWTILNNRAIQYEFIKEIMPFLGTLLGFTLAAIALILSSGHLEMRTRKYLTERKIRRKTITLYHLIIVSFSYLTIMEAILCLFYYISYLFQNIVLGDWVIIPNTIFIIGIFNILFATIRMTASLFFVVNSRLNT